MLPRASRLVASSDFAATVRRGRRIGRPTLVLHVRNQPDGRRTQVGFVVSKAVGTAVVRNRVKRRLRHLIAAQLTDRDAHDGPGLQVVVRALPAAAIHPGRLAVDFQRAWSSLAERRRAQAAT